MRKFINSGLASLFALISGAASAQGAKRAGFRTNFCHGSHHRHRIIYERAGWFYPCSSGLTRLFA
jgi:hypothetical protein